MTVESVDAELARLRKEFDQHSLGRLQAMRAAVTALAVAPASRDPLEELRRHFHAFAGSGTTYGRPKVTDLGDAGESLTADLLQRSGRASDDDIAALRRIVDELTGCFAAPR